MPRIYSTNQHGTFVASHRLYNDYYTCMQLIAIYIQCGKSLASDQTLLVHNNLSRRGGGGGASGLRLTNFMLNM